ncbi:MAG: BtpA/SgcQ family protein [Verrucomicrobiota bacterium]
MSGAGGMRVIGVVHLAALPGAPGWGGEMGEVVDAALADARAYEAGGCDAVVIENFGDAPFTAGRVGPETVAAMAVVGRRVGRELGIPFGFNVLRNDALAALALCAACGGSFIRVNVHTGAMVTDQGLIEGNAFETVRRRDQWCPEVKLLADVMVKHAAPAVATTIERAAEETLGRGKADGLIVSGAATGEAVLMGDLERVRAACPEATILVGSGVDEGNVAGLLEYADGVIVGTSVKEGGVTVGAVDEGRVRAFVGKVNN